MMASDCIVCAGPLHETWLGSALVVVSLGYVEMLVLAMLNLHIEHDVPARGIVWRALLVPFTWAWVGVRWTTTLLLPPERRPRFTRTELERRIEQLERELEIDQNSEPRTNGTPEPGFSTATSKEER